MRKSVIVALVALVGLGGIVGSAQGQESALARLRAERARQLERLRDYRLNAALPGGATRGIADPRDPHAAPGRAHTFIGDDGALCALAHLIAASGRRDLVERIARDDNGACIATTTDAELLAWVRTSGLTLEECVLIQEPGFIDDMEPQLDELRVERERERERALRDHLARVEQALAQATETSLRVAAARL